MGKGESFFEGWLMSVGLDYEEYRILSGRTINTLRRRKTGSQGCAVPPELELLMRALHEKGSPRQRLLRAKEKMSNVKKKKA